MKECDPDTSSSACSDKQGNIPPADSWHAIVTCCWILFQTVRPLAECLAFKCVQARVCTHACMWNSWFISTLYFTVVLVHSKRILHNLKKTLIYFILFFWSHRSVTSFFSPPSVWGQQRSSMCLAAVLPAAYVTTASGHSGFLGRACQHSSKIKNVLLLKSTKSNS